MKRHDMLYRLYEDYETETLRARQEFVDLFPPLDSPLALEQWETVNQGLDDELERIENAFPSNGEILAAIAARANRDQAFTALDLCTKYDRSLNALVLDVDETLRSAGNTDNEIPRETLYLLRRLHEDGMPIVICTGQTLENVKGFLIQGLGNEIVYSGDVSIVYEGGTGVFTPGHGPATKQLLYEDLDEEITDVFVGLRSNVLPSAPEDIRTDCHLQGNEFNVTLKPNFETGSDRARDIIETALVYLLDLLEECVELGIDDVDVPEYSARRYYAEQDPEIRDVLTDTDTSDAVSAEPVPERVASVFERVDVAYYEADAAEIGALELNKVVGVTSAFEVLDIEDPFALVMGDSKSDLRVMDWLDEESKGLAAAPTHASPQVLDHVHNRDELVFDAGNAAEMLRIAYALDLVADLE